LEQLQKEKDLRVEADMKKKLEKTQNEIKTQCQSIKSQLDLKLHDVNKSTFVCMKMPDQSVYYG
jgi:hypothetical protein